MTSPEKNGREKIIVRLPNWIGDCVLATPFLHALRKIHPEDAITCVGKAHILEILSFFPGINRRIKIGESSSVKFFFETVKKLRGTSCDRGYLLTNSFSSALAFYLGGVKIRVGYATDGRAFLLNQALPPRGPVMRESMVEYYMNLLSAETDVSKLKRVFKLYPDEKTQRMAERHLRKAGWDGQSRLVGVNPFAWQWVTKRWPPERFGELTRRLTKDLGAQCVFTGVEKDRAVFEKVREEAGVPVIDLVGKLGLSSVPALIEKYDLFITNDSGLMHVAAAVGTPIVAVFGPTDFERTAPYTDDATLIRVELDHEPCMKPVCCRVWDCMLKITVDEVFEAARSRLAGDVSD